MVQRQHQNFLTEAGFNSYIHYLAIKKHFTSSYDFHKYNGKVNATVDSFSARKDSHIFARLGKHKDYQNLILSNIIVNPKIWAGQLLEDSAEEVYLGWKKKQDSLSQHFKDSLGLLKDDFSENFKVYTDNHPFLLGLLLQRKISLEAFTILIHTTNSVSYWKDTITDTVIAPDLLFKAEKYHPFLKYDKIKVKKVIKDHFF